MTKRPAIWFARVAATVVLLVTGVVRAEQPAPAVQANRAPHPAPVQPLPFSHKTHVGMGVQCQTCHTNPGAGNQMTFPATATCMSCHTSIATDRPATVKLTEFAQSNQAIPWVRVYEILPGVTWTHRRHLQAGMQCETCHGAVGELDAMAEVTAVTGMATCISCHEERKASSACATCHAWPAG